MIVEDLQDLVGSLVTIKTVRNDEILAQLAGVDEDNHVITLLNPRIVFVNHDHQVALTAFSLTSDQQEVSIGLQHVLAVMTPMERTQADYNRIVEQDTHSEQHESPE